MSLKTRIRKADWESWKSNDLTELFFHRVDLIRAQAMDDWMAASWGNDAMWRDGKAEAMRTACKARAECAVDIIDIEPEQLGLEVEPDVE